MRTALSILAAALTCAAQDPRGTLAGRVSDSSGALVPGVAVRATNTETNVMVSAASNPQGNYEIPYLVPGLYRIEAELAGFKSWSRPRVELRVGDRLQIDIVMEVGSLTETVEVNAEAPVLESLTSTVAQVITSRQSTDLPQRGGSLAWLYLLTPGVVLPSLPAGGPWNIDQASDISVGGSGRRSFDFNVDGVSNNAYGGRAAFVPPPDMVQEVRVETSSMDASVGHTSGGSINISLKAGTNALHGSFGTALSTGPLTTRNFFINRFIFDPTTGPITPQKIKENTPEDRWWRYTASAGGPVYLPKLYDGRNRTFWMFGYQGHDRDQPVAQLVTVPAEAQRHGDFSALLALGAQYQIFDPHTTRPSGASRFQRDPLPGNNIPASRLDPAALKILNYFPKPNSPGTADGLQNFSAPVPKSQVMKQPVVRADHNFSEKHRMFARYSQSNFDGHFDKYVPGSDVRGRIRRRPHRGAAWDNVFVLSPQAVLDVRYGFTWFQEYESFDNVGRSLAEFGFPESLVRELDPRGVSFPQIGVSGLLQLGNNGGFKRVNYTHSLLNVLNWMKGNHSVKFGADLRLIYENNKNYGNVSPALSFDATYTRGPLDNSTAAPAGQGPASFLFGIPTGGGVDLNDSRAESSRFYSLFAQDDWRVTSRLTLNLGLRWEFESPVKERFNRSTRDFDFTTVNPIQEQARAQYAQAPIPEVPVSAFRTIGGVTFVGLGGNPRTIRDPYYRAFMPRAGFAYQFWPKTVVRGGYGVFFGLLGADFSDVSQPGFNQRTNLVASNDNGQTYAASISNPLPFGLEHPKGASGGLETYLGRGPGFFAADGRRPYTQRWNLTLEFEPLARTLVEIGYMGTRAVRLRVDTAFNALPKQYLSTLPERDQATIDYLSAAVQNPFRGIAGFAGTGQYLNRTIARRQLLQPYPHFGDLSAGQPAGGSWYHALLARFDRRLSAGLQLHANYTWSKTLEATSYLNDTDSLTQHVVSELDRPHRIVLTGIYELPFARRSRILGGWQVQAIYTGQSGPPLAFGNVIYRGKFSDIRLPSGERSLYRWFNTDNFEKNNRLQLGSNIRTFPARISGARADGINLLDMGLFKNFRLREGMKLQVRAEAEGASNHPSFDAPNTNPSSTLFGRVSGTQEAEGARRVFVGLKLIF